MYNYRSRNDFYKFLPFDRTTEVVFVSYRLNDSCALLVKPASTGLWAKCWSLCQTPWSCCSRSRCWSERGRIGPPSLRTQTSLCRSWWRSGSPSSVPVGPESRRQANHTSGLMCQNQSESKSCTGSNSKLSSLFWTFYNRATSSTWLICFLAFMYRAPSSGQSN